MTGGEEEDVDRMMGEQEQDGTYNGTLQQILGLGGFRVKAFLRSGTSDQEAVKKLGDKVLGFRI